MFIINKDQITIKLGLEFGIQKHTIEKYESLFSRYPFDFIILYIKSMTKNFGPMIFKRTRHKMNML